MLKFDWLLTSFLYLSLNLEKKTEEQRSKKEIRMSINDPIAITTTIIV